jgi:hypothetical protein
MANANVKIFCHWIWIFFAIWISSCNVYLLALTEAQPRGSSNGKVFPFPSLTHFFAHENK